MVIYIPDKAYGSLKPPEVDIWTGILMNQGKVRNSSEMHIYSETCIRQPLLGPLKSGRLGKVLIL